MVSATGVASIRCCQKLPPHSAESAGSKTDLTRAKVKPFSDSASVSGIMYLKRRKNIVQQQPKREE